ncbi:MAG: NAD(P)/FAD-dependent oxidoreductase [Chloroflexota bacterium]
MDPKANSGNGATGPDHTTIVNSRRANGASDPSDDLYDVTIIGAGPTGLFGAFYAGMRTMKTKVIDALPEPGGQLAALYPEKYIYDAPGFPKILAKDLVVMLVEQASQWNPTMCLGERVLTLEQSADGNWVVGTDKAQHYTKTVVVCAGVGAFAPNKLGVAGTDKYEGNGLHYFVKDKSIFEGKNLLVVGGGDSAVDWTINLHGLAKSITLIHRRDEFRAHESSVNEMRALPLRILTPYEVKAIEGETTPERVTIYNNQTKEEEVIDVDAVLVNVGFKADIGPIREWGLTLEKRGILVNNKMETNLPGVFAAGDIAAEEVKMNLIATGYGQAALAVNVAKHHVDPKSAIFPGHSSEKM